MKSIAMLTAYNYHPQIKDSTEKIDVKSEEPIVHESLAPSFGDINNASESVKELDEKMKLMIAITMKKLIELKEKKSLSWDNIQGCFNQNTSLVADSSPTEIVKEYVSESSSDFKFDGSADPQLVQKVMTWWESVACPDPDIRNDSKLDINSLAKIVAWSGATVTNFIDFWSKHERHERTLLEVGVMRYPTIAKPYFKVYRIKLFAWSDCTRTVWHQEDKNGIKSTVTSQTFRPNDEVLSQVKKETTKKAADEIDDMFP
ncbi:hypothetical protein F5878DRAFT_342263 [Lentinula raphanica]|uniref:Uncharacterized protein n=1 Tax=Lentinula raphanica TaxID=153919 RepID=A0AA38P1W0_9AGAR|nr:hypothetical protein F5880DRAFT_264284 [Lentinula raphanica]KAJ3834783.1 hypothetical protein F5878DRAFT_342263 [Lentinula raphanica]